MATRVLSAPEQVAECLRQQIAAGRWSGTLPGIHNLVTDLGFSRNQIERALILLEKSGELLSQGKGRKRRINTAHQSGNRPLRVAILDYSDFGLQDTFVIGLLRLLGDRGHTVKLCDKTLAQLRMSPARVARLVEQTEADAWILRSAESQVLEWFINQGIPAFSVFGGFRGLPIAGAGLNHLPSMLKLVRKLMALGHRRIVYLGGCGKLKASSSRLWGAVMEELEKNGIPTSEYNLPSWDDNSKDFHRALVALFQHTPPTAIIAEYPCHVIAILQFCLQRGIRVPNDLSLACMQASKHFFYCDTPINSIQWNYIPITRQISRWITNVSRGKTDIGQYECPTELLGGATIGPPP